MLPFSFKIPLQFRGNVRWPRVKGQLKALELSTEDEKTS